MKNTILIAILLLLFSFDAKSQAWEGPGAQNFSFGYEAYGLGEGVVLNYDYGLNDFLSIGIGGDYTFAENNFYLNLRSDYHLQHHLKLPSYFDIYAGLDIGYNFLSDLKLGFGGHAGLRLMMSDHIGVYLELGNRGNVGLSLNF